MKHEYHEGPRAGENFDKPLVISITGSIVRICLGLLRHQIERTINPCSTKAAISNSSFLIGFIGVW